MTDFDDDWIRQAETQAFRKRLEAEAEKARDRLVATARESTDPRMALLFGNYQQLIGAIAMLKPPKETGNR
jgi:hypothetical protein